MFWRSFYCSSWDQLIFYKYSLYQMEAAHLKELVLHEKSWCSTNILYSISDGGWYYANILYISWMEAADLKVVVLEEISWFSTNILFCIRWRQLTWRRWYWTSSADILQIISVTDGSSWQSLIFYYSDGGSWSERAGIARDQLHHPRDGSPPWSTRYEMPWGTLYPSLHVFSFYPGDLDGFSSYSYYSDGVSLGYKWNKFQHIFIEDFSSQVLFLY